MTGHVLEACEVMRSAFASSGEPRFITSAAGSSKIRYEAVFKMPSRASTPGSKPGSLLKRTLQDAFAEESARESEALERLGTQKHECAIGKLVLKRRKLENKAMEKQHQREHYEFRMLQMQMMLSQNQQTVPEMMQCQNQLSFGGFGLMDELNDPSLPSESPGPLLGSFTI
jgi:hypothetical protein